MHFATLSRWMWQEGQDNAAPPPAIAGNTPPRPTTTCTYADYRVSLRTVQGVLGGSMFGMRRCSVVRALCTGLRVKGSCCMGREQTSSRTSELHPLRTDRSRTGYAACPHVPRSLPCRLRRRGGACGERRGGRKLGPRGWVYDGGTRGTGRGLRTGIVKEVEGVVLPCPCVVGRGTALSKLLRP